jgi:hypothetical protein
VSLSRKRWRSELDSSWFGALATSHFGRGTGAVTLETDPGNWVSALDQDVGWPRLLATAVAQRREVDRSERPRDLRLRRRPDGLSGPSAFACRVNVLETCGRPTGRGPETRAQPPSGPGRGPETRAQPPVNRRLTRHEPEDRPRGACPTIGPPDPEVRAGTSRRCATPVASNRGHPRTTPREPGSLPHYLRHLRHLWMNLPIFPPGLRAARGHSIRWR